MRRAAILVIGCSLMACSAIYDADDFPMCEDVPAYEAPPCPTSVLECIIANVPGCRASCGEDQNCVNECLLFCYDLDGNSEIEDGELACAQCVTYVTFYQCIKDAGCALEVEATFCCSEARCDPARGCTEGQCDAEFEALNMCYAENVPDDRCDDAFLGCFPE